MLNFFPCVYIYGANLGLLLHGAVSVMILFGYIEVTKMFLKLNFVKNVRKCYGMVLSFLNRVVKHTSYEVGRKI